MIICRDIHIKNWNRLEIAMCKKKQKEKSTKIKIKPISLEIYDHNDKLAPQLERPIDAPDAKQSKDNIDTDNSAEKLQKNTKKGLIERLKLVAGLLPLMSGIIIIAVVIVQMHYANTAEQFYNIEGNLFYSENVYKTLVEIGYFAIYNLLLLPWILYISIEKKFPFLFVIPLVFVTYMLIFYTGLCNLKESINQGIYQADDVNKIILFYLNHPCIPILIFSVLGTVGFLSIIDKGDSKDKKKEEATECTNLKSNKIDDSNGSKDECKESNIITNIIAFFCYFGILATAVALVVWLANFISGVFFISNRGSYPQKITYEIVQNQNNSELNGSSVQTTSTSNIQVVILHRGSQVLLMNGKIDGKENINPQEDITSSSNLEIDTSSYEFQEASQYRFYRKTFNNVTTNAPETNNP